jgi:glycosyltransferase involved in cell wall biosynthesis
MASTLIITPFYNSYENFVTTYRSVTKQSYQNYEWIIVDDNSEKTQSKKLRNLVEENPLVKLIQNKRNLGAGASRNIGLSFFNHTYLTFIDSDDIWDKNFLLKMISFQKYSGCRLVFSGYKRYVFGDNIYLKDYSYSGTVSCDDILKGNPISCLTALLKPDKYKDLPKFGKIKMRNDLVFFYKALQIYGDAEGTEEILATYVMRNNSLSRNKFSVIRWQWYVYRYVANQNVIQAMNSLLQWAIYGFLKYSR